MKRLVKIAIVLLGIQMFGGMHTSDACDMATFILNTETDNGDGTYTYDITLCVEYLGIEGSPHWFGLEFVGGTFVSADSYSPASVTTGTSDIYNGEIVNSNTLVRWRTTETFPSHTGSLWCNNMQITTTGRAATITTYYHDTYLTCDAQHTLPVAPPSVGGLPRTCDFGEGTISVSASGFESGAGFNQTYVLVADGSDVILDIQSGGTFSNVVAGTYRIYAVNHEGTIPAILAIDSLWDGVITYDANGLNCFSTLGPKDGTIVVCESVCYQDSSISVSTSGFHTGSGYTQEYVLLNDNDSIISSNATGLFSFAQYQDSGVFQVYAVNTSDATVQTEIANGGPWSDIVGLEAASSCVKYIGARVFNISTQYCDAPMSLGKIVLNGLMEDDLNYLYWNSAYDDLTTQTIIQRSADNNWNFKEIESFETVIPQTEYEDSEFDQNAYYRIKQVLITGEIVYSNTIQLRRDNAPFRFTGIYPVPSSDIVNIRFDSDLEYQTRLVLTDMLGRQIWTNSFKTREGNNARTLNVNAFGSGVYYVTLVNEKHRISRKIIVTH